MAKMSLHDLKTPLKALKYFYFYIQPFFLVIEVHISPNGPKKAHVHPPVDWYWTADLGCELRLRSETNNFRNRNFTVRNILFSVT